MFDRKGKTWLLTDSGFKGWQTAYFILFYTFSEVQKTLLYKRSMTIYGKIACRSQSITVTHKIVLYFSLQNLKPLSCYVA